jgi:hypothetical protein
MFESSTVGELDKAAGPQGRHVEGQVEKVDMACAGGSGSE